MYFKKLLSDNSTDIKKTWRIINTIIQKKSDKSSLPDTFIINGEEISDPKIVTNEFNKYFSKIGQKVNDQVPKTDSHFTSYLSDKIKNTFFMNPVTPFEIQDVVKKSKPKTSKGFDNISMKTVQETIQNISIPLSHIFNLSFIKGIVPKQLKIAKIVPIHKSGPKNIFNNYRPISLLPAFSKILEKVVNNRLVTFLDKYNILYKHQYGFRKNHSTIHPIIHFLNHIADQNDQPSKNLTLSVFLDLSKAFDTLPHKTLLKKLEHYGIRGTCNSWFESYLSNREQFLLLNSNKSSSEKMSCGVPQGSILGPILFILFINDMYKSTKLNLLSFADDTTVYASGRQIDELTEFTNNELDKLFTWLCANKLQLNISKTKFVLFGPPQRRVNYGPINIIINKQTVDQIGHNSSDKSIKNLGLQLDENLTWNCHISYICKKMSQGMFVLNRVKNMIPQHILRNLYFTLINCHINYGIQIWGNSPSVGRVVKMQKRAIRIIHKVPFRSHTEPLFKSSNILKVSDIYQLQTALLMYDFNNKLLPSSFITFGINKISTASMETRQKSLMLTDRPRTTFSSRLPKHSCPRTWNSIDEQIRNSKSRYIFKRKLKKSILGKYSSE